MVASYLLSLREGFESALIIGIVISILFQIQRRDLYLPVWLGAACAALASVLAAWGLTRIGAEFEGRGEQVFEGVSLLAAVGIITWMIIWMKNNSRNIKADLQKNILVSAGKGGKPALFGLAFVAVIREGIELSFFLLALRSSSSPWQEYTGAALGLITAAILGWAIFSNNRGISTGRFFSLTNFLLLFISAGLLGLGIHEFIETGWLPAMINPIWNLEAILANSSVPGQILRALLGYESSPSLTQAAAYLFYLAVMGWFLYLKKLPENMNRVPR